MKKVLIVDDHAEIRRLLAITAGRGYEILEASDGLSAIYAIHRHQPDVVMLDVKLPNMDGLAVLDAIKSDPQLRHIPVALVTGQPASSDRHERFSKADACFTKPFSPAEVANWLKTV